MYWEYQTMLFEYRKDGLLGDKYIDDAEVEAVLNEQGDLGWELVGVTPVQEGLLAFLKKEAVASRRVLPAERAGKQADRERGEPEAGEGGKHGLLGEGELVGRPEKNRLKNGARGDNDLVGGIKIS